MAPIDIVQAQAEVARNEESVIVAEAPIRTAEDRLRTLIMNPSQPDFWTTRHRAVRTADAVAAAVDVDAAIGNALGQPHRPGAGREADGSDRHRVQVRAQPEAAGASTSRPPTTLVGTAGTQRQFDSTPASSRAPSSATSPAQLQRRAARRLRQRVQDLERAGQHELPDRHERAKRRCAQGTLQREQQTTDSRASRRR